MSVRGLDWQTIHVPFVAGLMLKGDPRAIEPPALDVALNVEFDDVGGLRLRKPYTPMNLGVVTGTAAPPAYAISIGGVGGAPPGPVVSDFRAVAAHDDELLLWTYDSLYGWDGSAGGWVWKGYHLAVKIDEATQFATTGDQADADRAELNNVVVYVWDENGKLFAAARDKITGTVAQAPTQLVTAGAAASPKIVALQTRFLIMWVEAVAGVGTTWKLRALLVDPNALATGFGGAAANLITNNIGTYTYDVMQMPGRDVAAFVAGIPALGTAYDVGTYTGGGALATSPKARNSSGPVAISVTPDLLNFQIARVDGTNVVGDMLDAVFTDVFVNQAIGTGIVGAANGIYQLTCAHQSVVDGTGFYRAYVFWTTRGSPGGYTKPIRTTRMNWVNTNNALGAAIDFVRYAGVASRAFDRAGNVHVWLEFVENVASQTGGIIGQLEDSYFLYRQDGFPCAKAVDSEGGGLPTDNVGFPIVSARLPGVASLGGDQYAWCATVRRWITLGAGAGGGIEANSVGFGARSPHDVIFTFDSNEARRSAKLGETVYVPAGEVLAYDGRQLVEVGFHVYPWEIYLTATGGGNVGGGSFAMKQGWRWTNSKGEKDRSTCALVGQTGAIPGPATLVAAQPLPLCITHKTSPALALEFWRTVANPTDDAPFYLVSSVNPYAAANPNEYVTNDPTVDHLGDFQDAESDATASGNEEHPENEGILESLSPPAASIVIATEDRLFLAGVADKPDEVWYSKTRTDGYVASFNDALTITVPRPGGKITALAIMNETLVVFRERAIYSFQGDGFDNAGGGQNYGPARLISLDCGAVNHESVCWTDKGLVFKSSKGWYLLNVGWTLDYIGAAVAAYDAEVPVSAHNMTAQHQVRILTANRMLVWDYLVNQWAEWTIAGALGACVWKGKYVYLDPVSGPVIEAADFSGGVNYAMDVETGWIKLDQLQGFGRVRWLQILGEYRSAHHLRVRIARDYLATGDGTPKQWTYFDDKFWTPSPTVVGSSEQVRIGPSQQRVEAIKVRITTYAADNVSAPAGEACKLTGISFECGIKRGLYRRLPAAQKD